LVSKLPPLSAPDLFALSFVGDPRLSPDGGSIAYCVKRGTLAENTYSSRLHLVPAAGGDSRCLTFGDQKDTMPRWSPDGRTLSSEKPSAHKICSPSGGAGSNPAPGTKNRDDEPATCSWPRFNPCVVLYVLPESRKGGGALLATGPGIPGGRHPSRKYYPYHAGVVFQPGKRT